MIAELTEREGVTVMAGGDVEAGGRVVGRTVAAVQLGSRSVTVVQSDVPGAEATVEVLEASGKRAITLSPTPGAGTAILAALEERK